MPSGTLPMTSSVVGLITSIVPAPAGSTHSPPMKSLSRTRASDAMAMAGAYSSIRVTGPSLTRLTAIRAPNTPPLAPSAERTRS